MARDADSAHIETRVGQLTEGGDLGWASTILIEQRDVILDRWLDVATDQPFHAGHREHAVADHIPHLYDALVAFLRRGAPAHVNPGAPLDDAAVLEAAKEHARVRESQGLQPIDVVAEFRLLRQEILASLRQHLPDNVPTSDVLAAELLVNDALDGAITIGLWALTDLIEALREDFLAATVHDVRQPLTLIKGSAQVVGRITRQPDPDLGRVGAEVERIVSQVDRMMSLLTTLTDASRIALHHLDIRVAPVDIIDVLRDAIQQFGLDAATRITINREPGVDTTGLWDRDRLLQVATNLLSNAVKYSPHETPITVTVRGTPDWLEWSVQDKGLGLAPEDLPRLFDRYSRRPTAIERGIEGSGLGLYLCRGVVEAHGGRIWASSPGPERGSTFTVVLPRAVPAHAEDSADGPACS